MKKKAPFLIGQKVVHLKTNKVFIINRYDVQFFSTLTLSGTIKKSPNYNIVYCTEISTGKTNISMLSRELGQAND